MPATGLSCSVVRLAGLFCFSKMQVVSSAWPTNPVIEQNVFVFQDDSRISAKCRDAKVEDVWSLTSFFGYSTQTFVLAVNLLDRFLAMIRVRDAHP